MSFEVFNNSAQGTVFIGGIIMTLLCTLATAGRFYSVSLINRGVSVEDWLALGALIFYYGYAAAGFTGED